MITKNDKSCWHCFFWMNYEIHMRPYSDGPEGLTIVEYILKCHEEHDASTCTKHTERGGCFLCEHKLSFPILCVKDEHLLKPKEEIIDVAKIETNDDPVEKFDKITINI